MKVDMKGIRAIVIRDKEGKMIDRFVPKMASVETNGITKERVLEFQKRT
jgi:hypothetical protein